MRKTIGMIIDLEGITDKEYTVVCKLLSKYYECQDNINFKYDKQLFIFIYKIEKKFMNIYDVLDLGIFPDWLYDCIHYKTLLRKEKLKKI